MTCRALVARLGSLALCMLLGACVAPGAGEKPVEASNPPGQEMIASGLAEVNEIPHAARAEAAQDRSVYRFAAGDEVSIAAVRRPELSLTTRLDPYGYISYPYLGQVRARGLTAGELADLLTKELQQGELYTRPEIRVGLVSAGEQFIYVLGEVKRPGPIPITGSVSLLAALGKAGGQTYDAEMQTVLWIRGSTTPPGVVKINLSEFGDPRSADPRIPNLVMIAGDVLFVPDSVIASVERFFIRFGNIISPLVELERGLVLYPEVERFLRGADPKTNNVIFVPVK